MMRPVALAVSFAIFAAPVAAHADWSGCYLGPTSTQSCSIGGQPAAILAAIAAPILVAGAASTIAGELHRRHVELQPGDDPAPAAAGKPNQPPSLSLMPPSPDPYREAAGAKGARKERRNTPNAAFEFNERATTVALVAGGALVAGAVIASIVKGAK